MTYITTAERIGMEKGLQTGVEQGLREGVEQGFREGIAQGLREGVAQGLREGVAQGLREGLLRAIRTGLSLKFGAAGVQLYPDICKVEDINTLEAVNVALFTAPDLQSIAQVYQEVACNQR